MTFNWQIKTFYRTFSLTLYVLTWTSSQYKHGQEQIRTQSKNQLQAWNISKHLQILGVGVFGGLWSVFLPPFSKSSWRQIAAQSAAYHHGVIPVNTIRPLNGEEGRNRQGGRVGKIKIRPGNEKRQLCNRINDDKLLANTVMANWGQKKKEIGREGQSIVEEVARLDMRMDERRNSARSTKTQRERNRGLVNKVFQMGFHSKRKLKRQAEAELEP